MVDNSQNLLLFYVNFFLFKINKAACIVRNDYFTGQTIRLPLTRSTVQKNK